MARFKVTWRDFATYEEEVEAPDRDAAVKAVMASDVGDYKEVDHDTEVSSVEEIEDDEGAYGEGECTCHRTGLGGNDPDAGWRLDRWCPIHGQDPDEARDRAMEDR
jgi:hypothetical protein